MVWLIFPVNLDFGIYQSHSKFLLWCLYTSLSLHPLIFLFQVTFLYSFQYSLIYYLGFRVEFILCKQKYLSTLLNVSWWVKLVYKIREPVVEEKVDCYVFTLMLLLLFLRWNFVPAKSFSNQYYTTIIL